MRHPERTMYSERGITESYLMHTSMYCLPIASTLTIHPSSEYWDSILYWTTDGKFKGWAIADGVLLISPRVFEDDQEQRKQQLLEDDDGNQGILEQLASRTTPLAVWEMKSLTEGTAQVMQEIVEMGLTHAKFPWKKCALTVCNHRSWEGLEESRESYDAGFDPHSPPWAFPVVSSSSTADSRPSYWRKSLRSAWLSYEESPMSPVEDDEGVREKRCRNDSDASEYNQPLKKSKADLTDQSSYELPRSAREGVDAQSFLQQVA
jgi:hypothetical protein